MPSTGISITNTFFAQTGNIPLSTLDANFSQLVGVVNSLNSFANYFVDTGLVNALAVAIPSPLTGTLTAGFTLQVLVAVTNTGASALTLSGGIVAGSVPIKTQSLAALSAGLLQAGSVVTLVYDGTEFQLQGTAPSNAFTNLSVGPPAASLVALTITSSTNSYAIRINMADSVSRGVVITDGGANASTLSLSTTNSSVTVNSSGTAAVPMTLNTGGAPRLTIGSAGGVTLSAVVSGDTLTLGPGPTGSLLATSSALANNSGASAGTLTNAPSVGNPTKWIKVNDNGTIRSIPAW